MEPFVSDHVRIDERSLAMHQLVAAKPRADLALVSRDLENLRRWQRVEGSPSVTLGEWEDILCGPIAQVALFLEERSKSATRLRQSSPFPGILTEGERRGIYESYSTRTCYSGRQPDIG